MRIGNISLHIDIKRDLALSELKLQSDCKLTYFAPRQN
jgi:hypothetical protein